MDIETKMTIIVKIGDSSKNGSKEIVFELSKEQAEELYSRLSILLNKTPYYITYTYPNTIYPLITNAGTYYNPSTAGSSANL